METAESRTSLLIGEMGLQRLKQSCVCVLGVGGVGSYCAEALARSGIGKLILVDGDHVALSNLNRQMMAQFDTIGQRRAKHEGTDPFLPQRHPGRLSSAVL